MFCTTRLDQVPALLRVESRTTLVPPFEGSATATVVSTPTEMPQPVELELAGAIAVICSRDHVPPESCAQ